MSKSSEPEKPSADTLGMDVEEMRRLAHKVVDEVIDHLAERGEEPAISEAEPQALRQILGGPLPEEASDADAALDLLSKTALRHQQHGDHPRYFARVPGPSSFAGILGDWLGIGFNSISASWAGGSGPSTVELVVIDWLRQLMGLPKGTEGVLVSGGSQGNLTAIAAVMAQRGRGMVYMSDQAHSSIQRALITLGLNTDELHILPCDTQHRLTPSAVREALQQDQKKGRSPLMVIATAGTTNTGSTDPLNALADLCEQEGIWFHIDGAYGAPAALTDSGRRYLSGMERADSLVLDPHKWLFQPYDTGCLLIRPGILDTAFSMDPEYLRDVTADNGEVDFRNRGLELTRRARALKLWLSFRSYGVSRFRAAIQSSIDLAAFAEKEIRDNPERWELISPAQIGILCFALPGENDQEHHRRAKALAESGYACLSTTVLHGRTVFRLCIINPLTTHADITGTLDRLASMD